MEHIIQFGVTVDDKAIIDSVKAKAEREIIAKLTNEVGCQIFERNPWTGYYNERSVNHFAKNMLVTFFEEHKEEIIDGAAKHLADKLARSKAGKAILEEL